MAQFESLRRRILRRLKLVAPLARGAEGRDSELAPDTTTRETQMPGTGDTQFSTPRTDRVQRGAGRARNTERTSMFQGWRFKLREAKDAFEQGRLEEARDLVEAGGLEEYLPGKRLSEQIAQGFADRAKRQLASGDSQAAWRDLATSHAIAGETAHWLQAREDLIAAGLGYGTKLLEAGDVDSAIKRLEALRRTAGENEQARTLIEIARRIESAEALARRGKFADATSQLTAASALREDLQLPRHRQQQYEQHAEQLRSGTQQLHRALTDERWSDAVSISEALLQLAPDYRIAKDARRRAWEKAGSKLDDSQRYGTREVMANIPDTSLGGVSPEDVADEAEQTPNPRSRFVLWVDAVGGFLVCLDHEVLIGQAVPGNYIQVPILGDLSRRHAKLRREGEGYLLEPLQTARINDRVANGTTLLHDGDEVQLGGVRLRFRQPHALSTSARLDLLTRHRTQPHVDAILLMAESCVLGPNLQNHVVCREWENDVVMYRQEEKLYCRTMAELEVDGRIQEGRAELRLNSRVIGPDFSLSLERLA